MNDRTMCQTLFRATLTNTPWIKNALIAGTGQQMQVVRAIWEWTRDGHPAHAAVYDALNACAVAHDAAHCAISKPREAFEAALEADQAILRAAREIGHALIDPK